MAGVMWRALARRMVENNWPLVSTKQITENLCPPRMAKKRFFSGLEGFCRTPPASSRIVARADFYRRVDSFATRKNKLRRLQPLEKIK